MTEYRMEAESGPMEDYQISLGLEKVKCMDDVIQLIIENPKVLDIIEDVVLYTKLVNIERKEHVQNQTNR